MIWLIHSLDRIVALCFILFVFAVVVVACGIAISKGQFTEALFFAAIIAWFVWPVKRKHR